MKLRNLIYLLLILPFLFFQTGCSSDDENPLEPTPTVNEAEVLVKYLEANGDFINTTAPAMIKASDVYADLLASANIAVIDIRSATDFATGHIDGAVNVTTANLLDYYKNNNLSAKAKVVIACYSGQTAGWATSLLRLAGYTNVYDLKWGMSSWNSQFKASWANSIGNGRAAEFVTTAAAKNAAGEMPTLSTGKTTGAEILEARIAAVLAEGFGAAKIDNGTLYTNLSNYYIVNYWGQTDYDWGHIAGAVQYTPKVDLKFDASLKTLPTDKTVVVYCYTGQTSAHVAPFLKVLGYDAKTLLFGVNAMSFDTMPGTKFIEATEVHEYPVVQ